MEGDLWKKSEHWRRWNMRWFRLEGNTLSWYARQGARKPLGHVDVIGGVIIATQPQKPEALDRWPFSLTFNSDKYCMYLGASRKDFRSEWIKVCAGA
jgi:hypothetical protein